MIKLIINEQTIIDRPNLTSSEKEVIKLVANGMSNSEISSRLSISINTVKFHLKNIYKKLQVHSRIAAINRIK